MKEDNDNLRSLLIQRETPELNKDFEDQLMIQIHKKSEQLYIEKKYIRLMYTFFGLGLVLGFILASFLGNITVEIWKISFIINKWLLQLPFVIVLLFVFEKIYKTFQYKKDKSELFEL